MTSHEIISQKMKQGFKSVTPSDITAKAVDRRVRVALLINDIRIESRHFTEALQAAKGAVEFVSSGVVSQDVERIVHRLQMMDNGGFDLLCIVRNRIDEELFSNVSLAATVANLRTPVIVAAGADATEAPLVCRVADCYLHNADALGIFIDELAAACTIAVGRGGSDSVNSLIASLAAQQQLTETLQTDLRNSQAEVELLRECRDSLTRKVARCRRLMWIGISVAIVMIVLSIFVVWNSLK